VAKDVDAKGISHLPQNDTFVASMVVHKVLIVKQENTKDFLKIIR